MVDFIPLHRYVIHVYSEKDGIYYYENQDGKLPPIKSALYQLGNLIFIVCHLNGFVFIFGANLPIKPINIRVAITL